MNAGCAGKTVRSLRTRAIPERLRGVFTTRRYTNPRLPYLTLLISLYNAEYATILSLKHGKSIITLLHFVKVKALKSKPREDLGRKCKAKLRLIKVEAIYRIDETEASQGRDGSETEATSRTEESVSMPVFRRVSSSRTTSLLKPFTS